MSKKNQEKAHTAEMRPCENNLHENYCPECWDKCPHCGGEVIEDSSPSPKKESWEEAFEKEFVVTSQGNVIWKLVENGEYVTHLKLKDFISQVAQESREQMRKECLEAGEKLREQYEAPFFGKRNILVNRMKVGYNSAINDFLSTIKNIKK